MGCNEIRVLSFPFLSQSSEGPATWVVKFLLQWAIAFNIRPPPPPVEDLPFLLTPEDWLKLHSPLKTAIKYGVTLEEFASLGPLKNMGLPLKNFVKIKASPLKNSIFFHSILKEILNFFNLPLENFMVPQPGGVGGGGGGGADFKCNNPIMTMFMKPSVWHVLVKFLVLK